MSLLPRHAALLLAGALGFGCDSSNPDGGAPVDATGGRPGDAATSDAAPEASSPSGDGGAAPQGSGGGGGGGGDSTVDAAPADAAEPSVDALPEPSGKRCIVHLHGKSGGGGPTWTEGTLTHVAPSGNAPGWGGLQWLYFPETGYREVRDIVGEAIEDAGCGRVIVHGFSNGASAAAKLYCRGERFDDTIVGYIVDDPVTDHAVEGCARPAGVKVRLYWTGGLASAYDGWDCASGDWTCEGGTTIGLEKYEDHLGVTATPSIHDDHAPYTAPPEYETFW